MAKKIALTRTISLQKDTLDTLNEYSSKYFQGNLSAAIGYMCTKYIEYEKSINKVMFASSTRYEVEEETKDEDVNINLMKDNISKLMNL